MRRRKRSAFALSTFQILVVMIGSLIFLLFYMFYVQLGIERTSSAIDLVVGVSLLLIGIAFIIALKISRHKWALTKAIEIADVDDMEGVAFEQYVGKLLLSQGYKVTFTPTTGDYGVDIVAKKEEVSYAVQVKRYKGRVGVEAINQAVAGKAYYSCNRAMVVTNSFFTNQAFALARANYVALINRNRLAEWIVEFQKSG